MALEAANIENKQTLTFKILQNSTLCIGGGGIVMHPLLLPQISRGICKY